MRVPRWAWRTDSSHPAEMLVGISGELLDPATLRRNGAAVAEKQDPDASRRLPGCWGGADRVGPAVTIGENHGDVGPEEQRDIQAGGSIHLPRFDGWHWLDFHADGMTVDIDLDNQSPGHVEQIGRCDVRRRLRRRNRRQQHDGHRPSKEREQPSSGPHRLRRVHWFHRPPIQQAAGC